jgi:hypothetical protein
MFELTNEQRKCFAIPPILDSWKKVEVKASPYDHYVTYAFLDGLKIVKVIQVSDTAGREMYQEFGVEQTLSEDGTKILPKTDKGKPQNFTSANLVKKTPIGMSLSFDSGYVAVVNNTADQCFYRSFYNAEKPETLKDFSMWVDNWCLNTEEKELKDINEFANRTKIHQKFKEGDFFRYRINRNLFGYGRILVDYAQMRKDGIQFWDVFMGKPLCVAVYHIATEDATITPEQLIRLKMLPSQMIIDNIFHYGECEIIGNMPIDPDEDNYTIHYGRSIDARKPNYLYYQSGKTYVALKGEKELDLHSSDVLGGFSNKGIGWDLHIQLPILLECIKKKSNEPYWDMIPAWRANQDLRNPKFKKELKQVKKQMGIK